MYNNTSWQNENDVLTTYLFITYICFFLVVGEPSFYDFRVMDVLYMYVSGNFTPEAGQEFCSTHFGLNGSLAYFESKEREVS